MSLENAEILAIQFVPAFAKRCIFSMGIDLRSTTKRSNHYSPLLGGSFRVRVSNFELGKLMRLHVVAIAKSGHVIDFIHSGKQSKCGSLLRSQCEWIPASSRHVPSQQSSAAGPGPVPSNRSTWRHLFAARILQSRVNMSLQSLASSPEIGPIFPGPLPCCSPHNRMHDRRQILSRVRAQCCAVLFLLDGRRCR